MFDDSYKNVCDISPPDIFDDSYQNPTQVNSRQDSPKSPQQVPPALKLITPNPPRQEKLPSIHSPGQSGPYQEQRPRPFTVANKRPRAES